MVAADLIFEAPDVSQTSGADVVVEHDANNYVVLLNHHCRLERVGFPVCLMLTFLWRTCAGDGGHWR